jgi:hypothetical protein
MFQTDARTRQTIESFVSSHVKHRDQASNESVRWNDTGPARPFSELVIKPNQAEFHGFEYQLQGLPAAMEGWTFLPLGLDLTTHQNTTPSFEIDKTALANTTFLLNHTASFGPGRLPYNSTITLAGREIPLAAPFLTFGVGCREWFNSNLGECICYKGQPLVAEFRNKEQFACVNGQQYAWGFSSTLTFVSLLLETAWAMVLFCLWSDARRSKLVRHGRSATGSVRSVLDFAEWMGGMLGGRTGAYTNKDLRAALDKGPPMGYALIKEKGDQEDGEGRYVHIGLVSVLDGLKRRKALVIDTGREYG